MATPSTAEALDELILRHLNTIDAYQQLRKLLSQKFAAGFLSLAEANYVSTRGRYGQDFYDQRMQAMRGVDIVEQEDARGVVWGLKEILPGGIEKEVGPGGEAEGEGLRQRKGKKKDEGEGKEDDDKEEKEQRPKVDPRDPIRWFGILVPPALRTAQAEFTEALTFLPSIATTLSTLSSLESQITHLRALLALRAATHVYKILTAAPPKPLPPSLPLSPLDESSGFIHLCTASQVPGVISRFMKDQEEVWLLKIPYERIEEDVKWEPVTLQGEGGEEFPHLFSTRLGAAEVMDVREFRKAEVGWVWDGVEWLEK